MEKYQFIRFNRELKEQVVHLQQYLWGSDLELNARYLDWKYFQNPYLAQPLVYLAVYQGQVVGMRGFYGSLWHMGRLEETWEVPVAADAVVHPDHRRKGLYLRIGEFAEDDLQSQGYAYTLSVSGSPAVRNANLGRGWNVVGEWQVWYTPGEKEKPPGFLKRLVDKQSSSKKTDEKSLFWHLDKKNRIGNISIEKHPRLQAMAELAGKSGGDHIRHVRDISFFSWRFDNPFSNYRFLYYGEGNPLGFLVLRSAQQKGKSRVHIVDWAAEDAHVLSELLAAAKVGYFPGIYIWSGWPSPVEESAFTQQGFSNIAVKNSSAPDIHRPTLMVDYFNMTNENKYTPPETKLLDIKSWHLHGIDSDNH